MSCVNKRSTEFRELAANNNIAENTLELIIHKYWLETGSEENYPSDVYIQAQLGNGRYQEKIPEVRQLWKRDYSHPLTYTSYPELQKAYQKAATFFPQKAIVYYKDAKGNYVLSVKQPVETAYATADDFFSQDFVSAKTLDLGLNETQSYGIDKVQELFDRFNTDRTTKHLADKVFALAKNLGLQISFNNDLPFGTMGRAVNNATITYKKSFFERDINNNKKAPILLHEVIHAITMYALSDSTKNWQRNKNLEQFRTDINQIYNEVKHNEILKNERGIHDVREFVAELANPIFREKLQKIDAKNKQKQSLWQRILNAFKSLLGIHTSSPYYNRAMNALEKAMDAFDIDSWLKYNNLKAPLQKAYSEHRVDFNEMSTNELKSMLKEAIKENSNTLNTISHVVSKELDTAIKTGKWDEKTINEYNSLIQNIQNGKIKFRRIRQESRAYTQEISQAHAGASILLAANERTVAEKSEHSPKRRNAAEQYEEDAKQGKQQEKQIESWAKAEDLWLNDYTDPEGHKAKSLEELLHSQWEYKGQGSEAEVYLYDNKSVLKSINLSHVNDNVAKALDRIALFNQLFPNTAMQVVGFGRDSLGHFKVIVKQPFIQGETLTTEELKDFRNKYGIEEGPGWHKINKETARITDLSPNNILKDKDGNYFVIDADIEYLTPAYGGKVQFENSFTDASAPSLSSFIDSMSKEQLTDELTKIQQEFADYDLSAEEEERPKGPSTFTFRDGTTIHTPFKLNGQQAEALNVMDDFMHSDDTSMTLSGYAGTGKTSLMEMLAQKAKLENKNILFSATTNKAAAVLASKVAKQGFTAQTLNKVFGINVEIDTQGSYDVRNLVSKVKEADIDPGTTVIIDEASMINEEHYKILNQVAEENALKIIYVGDRAQLAPVGENKVSIVFRNANGKVIELTQVERTDDNAILKEATNIRNGKPLSQVSSFNEEGKGVAFINPKEHRSAIDDVINHYVKGLAKDSNFFRILTYTNESVASYNAYVRKKLGYTDNIPRVGEPIMGYTNWGYDYRSKTYEFINSESYKVIKVGLPTKQALKVKKKRVNMTVIPITLRDSLGNERTFNFMDIKGNPANAKSAILLAVMKKQLWEEAKHAYGKQKAALFIQINSINQFLFVNDDIKDEQGHYLQNKTFDYGYAITVHKSQGSTFTNILLDENNISKAPATPANHGNPETATMVSAEDVNLGFGEELSKQAPTETLTAPSPSQETSENANMRQELEYVGISRATDTATVISSKAQTEDSPLNHLKGSKTENTAINQTDETLNNKQQNNNEQVPSVTQQLIDHIQNALGIKMLSDGEAKEYLRQHGYKLLDNIEEQNEMSSIKEQSIKNNTFMKAPNGKPTKLNERQWLQVRTKAFKDWFGDWEQDPEHASKVIDENGEPKVMYHATPWGGFSVFKQFQPNTGDRTRAGQLYFGTSESMVHRYLRGEFNDGKREPKVYPVFLNIRNPYKNSEIIDKKQFDSTLSDLQKYLYPNEYKDIKELAEKNWNDDEKFKRPHQAYDIYDIIADYFKEHNQKRFYEIVRQLRQNGHKDGMFFLTKEEWEGKPIVFSEDVWKQVWVMDPNQIKSATDNNGNFSNTDDDIFMAWEKRKPQYITDELSDSEKDAIRRKVYAINEAKKSLVEVNGYLYLVDHSDQEGINTRKEGQEGFQCIAKIPTETIEKKDKEEIIKDIENGNFTNQESVNKVLELHGYQQGVQNSDSIDAKVRKSNAYNDGLAQQASEGESRRGFGNGNSKGNSERSFIKTGYDGTNHPRYMEVDRGTIQTFETPDGEIYGFVTPDGRMYLDTKIITPEHPIHEYTHLWDNVVQKRNPRLWKRGVSLMQQFDNSKLWNKVARSEQYGKRWQQQGLRGEQLINRIASEVHAKLVGENGAKLLDEIAKKKGQKGIVAKLKEWILDMWKDLKATFSNWSDDEIQKLTLKDFNHMTVRDFADAVSFEEAPASQTTQSSNKVDWARTSNNGYEVSTQGDSRFSALKATFKQGTTWQGQDISGKTIEDVYQNIIKKSRKGQPPAKDSILNIDNLGAYTEGGGRTLKDDFPFVTDKLMNKLDDYFLGDGKLTKADFEEFSYYMGYLPLWKLWAEQHPEEMNDLRQKSQGKTLTDKFASTRVSQARALADIINSNNNTLNKSISVHLPGYEHFNNFYENITVDAAWKIPLLQDLDGELSNDNTAEQNQEIVNKMKDILFASTEEDIKEISQEKEQKIQQILNDYDKLNTQFDNLLNGVFSDVDRTTMNEIGVKFTASEVRHVAELIGNYLSDLITQIQSDNNKARELFPELNFSDSIDFTKKSRVEVADIIGIENLINKTKYDFDADNGVIPFDSAETIMKSTLIAENWDAMMYLASDTFGFNEGFSIKRDYSAGRFKLNETHNQIAYDDFNNYQDTDIIEEKEGDAQEHWQVEQRTIDVLNSMSALVRQGIHECYILDEHGNKVLDPEWLLPLRMTPRDATNSMLHWFKGALSLKDMITKLQEKQSSHPWVSQLITRLSDTSGKEADFQSQFYGVFAKPFQLYGIVRFEKGQYYVMEVNRDSISQELMGSIASLYKIGKFPIVSSDGEVNRKLLGNPTFANEENSLESKSEQDRFTLTSRLYKHCNIVRMDYGKEEPYEGPFTLSRAYAHLYNIERQIQRNENDKRLTQERGYTYTDEVFSKEAKEEAIKWFLGVYKAIGYPISDAQIAEFLNAETCKKLTDVLGYMLEDLWSAAVRPPYSLRGKDYQPLVYGAPCNIRTKIQRLLKPIIEKLEDTGINAFYDSGKMYQSYVTPSFMTNLIIKFKSLQGQAYEDFLQNNYGNSEWFKTPDGYYRNWMLRQLDSSYCEDVYSNADPREVLDFKVELNFNKHQYMRDMKDPEYALSVLAEYFSILPPSKNGAAFRERTQAWFRMPMQSNKPSSEFFRFFTIETEDFKERITKNLYDTFLQELSRIQTVRMRNRKKTDADFIKNFDTNGRKFNFLPFLNSYLEETASAKAERNLLTDTENTRLASLLQQKIAGLEESKLSADEEAELMNLVTKAIRSHMESRAEEILNDWEQSGIMEMARKIQNIVPDKDFLNEGEKDPKERNKYIRKALEKFIWNDYFMTKNILQLTVGDIAFLKDTEDLQKRLAQLHAPGIRGYSSVTDYEGHRVSDGKYRTVVFKDFDNFVSNIIANIAEVFDRKIAAAPDSQKEALKALKESLVGEQGKYRQINVTDAQGFSSPSSYRKKAFIFGKWSREAEKIYQKLLKGEYNYTDLETAFQPLKPFVYTHLQKNMGVENAPIHMMHVPFQAKNSEYLLIMADAILQGESLSRPNLLRAVYRVMEESERLNPTQGIDTVQFESAIKSGLQGAINIGQFQNMEGGEEAAFTYMMEQIYTKDADGNRTNLYNTQTFVHEAPYDDYCLQQEVPEHFQDHEQALGSQDRMIIPSDLDEIKDPNVSKDNPDNIVYYEWTDPNGTQRKATASEFRREYEETAAANINEDFNQLWHDFHLDSKDKRERNITLSRILQSEILSSPRYGVDLLQACSVDKETGEFRIPKGDPIQSKRIEQLLNSIIKNRINKQKIAGGPIVQVTNFGTSRQLRIKFNDRQGGILKTKEEFESDTTLKEQYGSYKKYQQERQAGIAYFEVFMPMWSQDLFEKFADDKGSIDVEAIENADPELLRMVSYRIPTEDKYSIAPMKVVGFMPREAGSAIMLPYELTEIDDSDFDVDKRYVIRKDLRIVPKPKGEIVRALLDRVVESYNSQHKNKLQGEDKEGFKNAIDIYVSSKLNGTYKRGDRIIYRDHDYAFITDYLDKHIYRKVVYTTLKPNPNTKIYRNNKLVDMTLAVLTNEMTADKILNPGGFDIPKKMGYQITAFKNAANKGVSWEALQKMSIDELKNLSYTAKDLAWIDTQVQFYKQNSASSSLIGVFAVNKVAHAVLESNEIFIDLKEIVGDGFTIAGKTFEGRIEIDEKVDDEGTLIGKTLGSLVSASADGVKDPVLNLMNINMTTANVLNTLLRLGMPFHKAALFLSQNAISEVLRDFDIQSLSSNISLNRIIQNHLDTLKEANNITSESAIQREELSESELIKGLLPAEHQATDYKVLSAFQKLLKIAGAMRNPTFATRFNSISSAVGPLIIDNLITKHKMEQFGYDSAENDEGSTHFYDRDGDAVDIESIFSNHPILQAFAKTTRMAEELFKDMPAGSEGFKEVLNSLKGNLSNTIFSDKALLSKLSDFYQSYLSVAGGLIDVSQLRNMIENFPKQFLQADYKSKYPDNALIQAIRVNTPLRTKIPQLEITITGMNATEKEKLSSAWTDLHKENPELSKKLFAYNFFRAGIGFSPKTFMALVPIYVKEHLTSADGSTSYVDIYRNFPSTAPANVVDQFIRNNWSDNKLVPWKGGKNTHYRYDNKKGQLEVTDSKEVEDLKSVPYMKTKSYGETYLWRQISGNENQLIYQRITPLGDNGRYLEISSSEIKESLTKTKETLPDHTPSELEEQTSPEELPTENKGSESSVENKKVEEFIDLYLKQTAKYGKTQEDAMKGYEEIKKHPKQAAGFLQNVFKQKGLTLNKEEAIEEFKKYC